MHSSANAAYVRAASASSGLTASSAAVFASAVSPPFVSAAAAGLPPSPAPSPPPPPPPPPLPPPAAASAACARSIARACARSVRSATIASSRSATAAAARRVARRASLARVCEAPASSRARRRPCMALPSSSRVAMSSWRARRWLHSASFSRASNISRRSSDSSAACFEEACNEVSSALETISSRLETVSSRSVRSSLVRLDWRSRARDFSTSSETRASVARMLFTVAAGRAGAGAGAGAGA